jgi:signal transduction histidine kinase
MILEEIAADMRRPQGDDERQAKSEGNSSSAPTSTQVPSRSHARQRERQGFQIGQMVAEYRALRATVLRLWSAASSNVQIEDLEDVTRFNEAVDQAIAESLQVFVTEVDRARDLFLGMLGHDLRGPLSTIATSATLEVRTRPNDSQRAAVILRSVAQMKALLDDLVEYTRHRLGSGLAIAPAPVQLDDFVRNTLDEISAMSAGRILELAAEGDLQGEWDARRLHQALSARAKMRWCSPSRTPGSPLRPDCCRRSSTRLFVVRATTAVRTRSWRVPTWDSACMSCARSPKHTAAPSK